MIDMNKLVSTFPAAPVKGVVLFVGTGTVDAVLAATPAGAATEVATAAAGAGVPAARAADEGPLEI